MIEGSPDQGVIENTHKTTHGCGGGLGGKETEEKCRGKKE